MKSKALLEGQFPPAELRFMQRELLTFSDDPTMEMKRKKDWVKITIQDSGIGIEEKDIPRIFVPSKQADKFMSRQYQGMGLSLSLAGIWWRCMEERFGRRVKAWGKERNHRSANRGKKSGWR